MQFILLFSCQTCESYVKHTLGGYEEIRNICGMITNYWFDLGNV